MVPAGFKLTIFEEEQRLQTDSMNKQEIEGEYVHYSIAPS